MNRIYDERKLDLKQTNIKLNSWKGHAKNADSYFLMKKVESNCKWLYDGSPYNYNKI